MLSLVSAVLATNTAHAQVVFAQSRFDASAEGWTARDVPSADLCHQPALGSAQTSSFVPSGGNPGGYFFYREPSNTGIDPLLTAPAVFHGDFSAAYGGFLRYDRRLAQSPGFSIVEDVYLQASVAGTPVTLIADTVGQPFGAWLPSRVPLHAGVWKLNACDGAYATEAEIRAVLANLTGIRVKAEYRSGAEDHGIDNVVILGPTEVPQSTFETDIEGWTVIGDAAASWFNQAGLHPQCLRGDDDATGQGYYFAAPSSFLGDQSAAFGRTLELDLWASPAGSTQPDGGSTRFVTLRSGDLQIYYNNSKLPITGALWRYHAIPLIPCDAWRREPDGAPATLADFQAVLSNLTRLAIRGEYRTGDETELLDNIVLGTDAPSGVLSPTNARLCAGATVLLSTVAAGRAPHSFAWQIDNTAGAWVELSTTPVALPCGGTASVSVGDDASTIVTIRPCLGVTRYNVRAVISNEIGSVSTNAAAITVCAADFNCDAALNSQDFFDYLNAFFERAPSSDFNNDGALNSQDYFDFLTAFFAGC